MRITQQAIASLAVTGIRKMDAMCRSFTKAEKIFDLWGAPRVIQPRDPRYVVATSKFLKRLEGVIYKLLAKLWGGPTVMKGFNADQTASHLREMWDSFDDPVAVGLDASRFDQHVSGQALKWEHSIYELFYRGRDLALLRKMLGWQVDQKGVFRAPDGKIKYSIHGGRASGDINTALGNCLLMSSLVKAYCDSKRIKARLANNGDDCVVFMNKSQLARFSEGLVDWFREAGFTMKVEAPVSVFEKVVFCQTQPIWVNNGWRMCRQFPQCLRKDTMFIDVRPDEVLDRMAAIGVCGTAVAAGVPCLQALYEQMASLGKGKESSGVGYGFKMMSQDMVAKHIPVTHETRLSFMEAFGINPHYQVLFERQGIRLDYSPVVFSNPLV